MYHITSRGNRKDTIFHEKDDYIYYLHLLEKAQKRFPFKLHSYCLMPNHIHLLIEGCLRINCCFSEKSQVPDFSPGY
ncbi:transposase [Bacillus sp. P14.5]|uniref:transposase n=1 Tax=Bacillus sp. P14.5 TaxID=1983400 RepID=UPI001F0553B7|nr:transposase [Bacillus sp. P14.5]